MLHAVDVPCAAAVFVNDPFVDVEFSRETAARIRSLRTWETNAHDRNALRADGGEILDHLFPLAVLDV